jgi:hypothetical protein
MHSLAFGAAALIAVALSFGVKAADLAYPPPVINQSPYGVAPPAPVPPPRVIVVPGPYSAQVPSPYDVAPSAPPRSACPPEWRCGYRGCGWQPVCAPHSEYYSGRYGPPIYSGPEALPRPEPYPHPLPPQVYSGPMPPPYTGDQSYEGPYRQYP